MSIKKRILVVDDEPDHCALVQRILEKAGYEVEVAYDGRECLEKVKSNPPDAIVLDVVMPEKDGMAVCRALKADRRHCRIPIMILTAESSPVTSTRFSRDRSMYVDADDYLPKPASPEEITRGLKLLLNG
jgi:two-component system, OmpR family, alkaline phosphatase synthesis response regulator PhoP